MNLEIVISIALILLLGAVAQWISWRLNLPSILALLLAGFLAGPVFGVLDPNALLGDLLFPFVSISVAVILFEGGLSLRFNDLPLVGGPVVRMVTVGVATTWLLSTAAAVWVLDFPIETAFLIGAILVVTGPTVIGPLLRVVRPRGASGPILKWEGLVTDPLGAVLAVLVYEVTLAQGAAAGIQQGILVLAKAGFAGLAIGWLGGRLLTGLLARDLIPAFLHVIITLAVLLCAVAASDAIQAESGLLAATVMGIVLANQRRAGIEQIARFKEHLGILLITLLFVVLSARLDLETFRDLGWRSYLFTGILIVAVRPATVLLSTVRTSLGWRDRAFIASMAPRGIVAAAMASLFALELEHAGVARAGELLPVVAIVIVATVLVYGLSARPLAQLLGLVRPATEGILFIGANRLARMLAEAVRHFGHPVLLVDTNSTNVLAAKYENLPTREGNALSQSTLEQLDFEGLGRLLAVTSNDEVNLEAIRRYRRLFDDERRFRLAPQGGGERPEATPDRKDAHLFSWAATYLNLTALVDEGAEIRGLAIHDGIDIAGLMEATRESIMPLFLVQSENAIRLYVAGERTPPETGEVFVGLFCPGAPYRDEAQLLAPDVVGD